VTIVFLDTETTSLRHDRRVWELAYIVRRDGEKDWERTGFIDSRDLDFANADPFSLKIGGFYDRHPQRAGLHEDSSRVVDERTALLTLERYARGATIVGAVPNFDTEVLSNRMRAYGICPSWHYHLVDVETLAAGAVRKPPPWDFDGLLAEFGLKYDEADRHTARTRRGWSCSPTRSTRSGGRQRPVAELTEREMAVLVALASGKTRTEMAREWFVSINTVKAQGRSLLGKLGARTGPEAVAVAFQRGILRAPERSDG
jgi:DNA-binding CsgD family transcriptional regulator